ncbi:DUF2264 domain-containing protein [Microbacterium telephonicum]|uniref:Uncharacterized protein DUF2264 n=1 Tax=Microbacterium telephonicum TaxID=1714841 RepID=A0A498C9S5_9MICO|nr:DUF2264 domain-containing protein [Microbacterium telephonicum]RLK52694.1 uncharacterized protein DUF2264 [Microbacterium telephonicum]
MADQMSAAAPSETLVRDWTRDQWLAHADRLLAGARVWASDDFARITPPGASGGYGRDVDGLEGFARTFLLAGFRIAGARGEGVDGLISDYSRGIAAGVDPENSNRWVRMDEHAQAKVEAASLALILDMTRPWIWDRLDALTQQRVIDYFAPVVGDETYPQTNWVWFRIVVQTFLRSVGGPWSAQDIAADLARHDSFARGDGWLSDGDERSFDHYVGWALHLYPVLWSRMQGADDLAGGRTAADIAGLDRFLQDAITLVGADGSPLIQGRSLVYRFAAAAPFWVGAIAGVPSVPLGQLRVAASAIVDHFASHGAPDDDDDLLTLGWHGPWRRLAQNYSGTGSPYWAVKGMLGIALPADHPVWTAPAVPLPAQRADDLRVVAPAGWVVSGTAGDGIVRVYNHGTDHAAEGTLVGDSPLYARIGYATAAAPLLNGDGWAEPLEQSVALVHADGRGTHRAAMTLRSVRVEGDGDAAIGVASSTARAHWITPAAVQVRHGSGITGEVTVAGEVTTHSLVRGAWEVRIATVDALEPGAAPVALRIGGWAVSGDEVAGDLRADAATAASGAVTAVLHALTPGGTVALAERSDASPLGAASLVPIATFPVAVGTPVVTALALTGDAPVAPPTVALEGDAATITWPDGIRTVTSLTDPRTAMGAGR